MRANMCYQKIGPAKRGYKKALGQKGSQSKPIRPQTASIKTGGLSSVVPERIHKKDKEFPRIQQTRKK